MTPTKELRAAVEVLRDPCHCLPHARLFADLLEAIADDWPRGPVHTSTAPQAAVRQCALAVARAVNPPKSPEEPTR
jgi:hypothetical protein